MKVNKRHLYTKVFILLFTLSSGAAQTKLTDEICVDPDIRTIMLVNENWERSMPIIQLDGEERLELHFDRFGDEIQDYSYSLQYCTYNWEIADNPEREYIEGFNDISIYDADPSSNTTVYYTHYSAKVPSEDIRILKSGNYLLKVYKYGYPDEVVFTKRFCVVDPKAGIFSEIRRPGSKEQELLISLSLENLELDNPVAEIKLVVIKNYGWENQVKIKGKGIYRDNALYFDMPYQIITPGGNEYRNFDIKNTDYVSERIQRIEFRNPYFHVFLKPDELKQFTPYFSSPDLNGLYAVETNDVRDKHTESDYVYVHFKLVTSYPFDSDVYIYGALTGWKTDEHNFMEFNPDLGMYQKTLFLKQGYYNYQYVLKDFSTGEPDIEITEGSHAETENMYMILVYTDRIMDDYDELIGYEVVSSVGGE